MQYCFRKKSLLFILRETHTKRVPELNKRENITLSLVMCYPADRSSDLKLYRQKKKRRKFFLCCFVLKISTLCSKRERHSMNNDYRTTINETSFGFCFSQYIHAYVRLYSFGYCSTNRQLLFVKIWFTHRENPNDEF